MAIYVAGKLFVIVIIELLLPFICPKEVKLVDTEILNPCHIKSHSNIGLLYPNSSCLDLPIHLTAPHPAS